MGACCKPKSTQKYNEVKNQKLNKVNISFNFCLLYYILLLPF